ncbi:MAG: TAXI family TRAP transporter solute-binding subunit, partial [Bradyrhizobium icense]
MVRRIVALSSAVFSSLSLIASAPARAEDVKLPPSMAMTAYDTGTAGFNIAVGVGKMMKDKYGSDVRVLPAGNDVARLAPLRAKRALVSATGTGSYFAQEGLFEFGAREWGPQPLQLLLSSVDCNSATLGVAADTGVKQVKDLKGKRVGFVVGSPALNQNALAVLAFGGLTRDDVKIVEFASYGAMWKGMVNNDT